MGQQEDRKAGALTRFLVDDHRRLDALFQAAAADLQKIDWATYNQFRSGLLRHIGMEERILLPALQRLRGGTAFPHAARLRLDHSALAALLMPTPTPSILATIRAILSAHNRLEEGPDGLYEVSDHVTASEADSLIASLRVAPEVTVMPHSDSAAVMKNLRGALERAGYRLTEDEFPHAGLDRTGNLNEGAP